MSIAQGLHAQKPRSPGTHPGLLLCPVVLGNPHRGGKAGSRHPGWVSGAHYIYTQRGLGLRSSRCGWLARSAQPCSGSWPPGRGPGGWRTQVGLATIAQVIVRYPFPKGARAGYGRSRPAKLGTLPPWRVFGQATRAR